MMINNVTRVAFYKYTSLLIPISPSYWPRKLQSPLRESITFSWYYVMQ